jgi:hypothetical protein
VLIAELLDFCAKFPLIENSRSVHKYALLAIWQIEGDLPVVICDSALAQSTSREAAQTQDRVACGFGTKQAKISR